MKNVEDVYPLSPMQQGMLFHSLCAPRSEVYIDQASCLLRGDINIAAFQKAWRKVVERHSVLRTAFVHQGLEQPLQIVRQQVALPWDEQDWRNLGVSQQQAQLESYLREDRERGFDLTRAPLMRCAMLQMEEKAWQFVWSFHHMLLDGWCTSLLLREVFQYYEAFSGGVELELARPRPYRDYIEWLKGQDMKQAEAYWRNRLAGFTSPTPLGIAAPVDAVHLGSSTYAEQQRYLAEETTSALEALARQQQVTLNTVVQGAWAMLLSRYSGELEVVFGATVSGRPVELAGVEEMVGLFINSLPVRVNVSAETRLGEWLQELQREQAEMRQYEYSPLVEVQGWSQVERGLPLFESLLAYENYPVEQVIGNGSDAEAVSGKLNVAQGRSLERTNYPLTLVVGPGRKLFLKVLYEEQRIEASAIERLLGHLEQLLESISVGPEQRLSELRMLTTAEEEQLVVGWNQTWMPYPRELSIAQLFEQQAALRPDAVAVIYEGAELTYGELNERANQLAHYLRRQGVGPDVLVGLCLERSLEMVIALVGIVKAGGAYLPLDPDYPEARLALMIEEAGASIVLTKDWPAIADESIENPAPSSSGENLAYVSYTSGSTGRPKGVAVPQRGVLRLVFNTNYISLGQDDVVLQMAPLSFDASTLEVWGALLNGGRLVVMRAGRVTLAAIAETLEREHVTTLWLTAGLFHLMVTEQPQALAGVTKLLAGGDVLQRSAVEQVLANTNGVLINGYGPTENTTFSCCHVMERSTEINGATVPIGRAVANTRVYVVDQTMRVVPVGVSGELLLGGDGLARGYVQQPELTAASFIPDPFSGEPGARLYRTGDVVRYRANGELEFVGRRDEQVKVRGYRIELGEVELALASHPAVKESVVIARRSTDGGNLIGYVVWHSDESVSPTELRDYLSARLPEYMIPGQVVELDELPLNANGKVDRRALPLPEELGTQAAEYEAPRTPVEEILAGIWADVLGVNRVGIRDNFFELGGHSLKATQIVSRVRESFKVELPLRTLFEALTLDSFAKEVDTALRTQQQIAAPPLVPVSRDEQLPLSFAQQRLWFLDQLDPFTATYNIPSVVRLRGPLRFSWLSQAVNEVVRRHESLRTCFVTERGRASQLIYAPEPFSIPLVDLTNETPDEQEAEVKRICAEEARQPFELSTGPLLRVRVLRLDNEQHVLLLTMHHIISDGWSMSVLMGELVALYDAFRNGKPSPLPPLPIQYADYATWQREWLQGEALEQHLDYWRNQLAGAPPVLELPADHPRPAVQSFTGAMQRRRMQSGLLEQLESLSRREGLTLYMTLLTAFKLVLARYSGQSEIVVGTPIAGRTRSEIEGLIGFFVNTLVLRTKVAETATLRELLGQVREVCLGAYTHQEVSFEQLVEQLQPERDLSHQPLFQVMFEMEGDGNREGWQIGEIQVGFEESESEVAKFDLTLRVKSGDQGLECGIEYKRDLYEPATIDRMLVHIEAVLRALATDLRQKVAEIELLSDAERQQLLVEWNDTRKDYDHTCIHQLFEQQAALTPNAIAVVYEGEPLSYGELNRRSNQLAHQLQSLGVGPESLVGICVERSPEMIVGLLGILKAGGAYLPLDPEYPRERLSFMLNDSRASVLLTQASLAEALSLDHPQPIYLDSGFLGLPEDNPVSDVRPENLAYVIYTSGSTGVPKGVQIEHRTVVNFLSSMLDKPGLNAGDALLAVTSLSFDIAGLEIFLPLICGARLELGSREVAADGRRLKERVIESGATVMQATPATWRLLAAAGWDGLERLRRWCGGEALNRDLANQLAAGGNEVWNLYGPTETTIWSASWRVAEGIEDILIGKPIANTEMYVVDKQMRPVPVGVIGELLIGGDGLSRGYLNSVELTAQRFIPDPFSQRAGARLYRTGDLAKYRPDGTIECLGRVDNQVKIRGYRIELGEIEAALTEQDGIRDSVATVKEDSAGNKRLVAYLVTEPGVELSGIELRKALRNKLPDYMIPVRYMKLDELPLTPNGKVDRKALPEPDRDGLIGRSEYQPPRNDVEETLATIWANVLGVKQVGINDNFFELGGDSILSIQIIAQAREAGFQITPKDLFKHQTIASLGEIIGTGPRLEAEQGVIMGPVELTPGQRWFFAQQSIDRHHFNHALLLQVRRAMNPQILSEAAQHLLTHHDALRLRFREGELGWQQFHAPADERISFEVVDLMSMTLDEQTAAIEAKAESAQASLSLADGPMLRLVYFDCGLENQARLLIVCHHLVIDGISWRIVLEDLQTAYEQLAAGLEVQLPAKTTSFQHWAQALKDHAGSESVLAQADYWTAPERAVVSSTPRDNDAGENTVASLQSVNVALSAEETEALLHEVPAVYHTQIGDILLSAVALALTNWTGDRRVLIDMEGHGREPISDTVDVSRTAGWFTTMYPVLLEVGADGEPSEVVKSAKEQLRQVPDQGLGYGLLRYLGDDANVRNALAKLPQAEVIFNYSGQFDQALSDWFEPAREHSGPSRSPRSHRRHLLEISGAVVDGCLQLTWGYSENIHRRATIEKLAHDFSDILRELVRQSQTTGIVGFTPSDFPEAALSQRELDQLIAELT